MSPEPAGHESARQGSAAPSARELASDGVGYWNVHLRYYPERDAVWREVVRVIQRDIPPDARILDLGAGYCHFVNHVQGCERHALDREPRMGEFAAPGVRVHVGACTDLSRFADGAMDVVFASNLFEHLSRADFERTVREVRRVLSPGGRLIALQPNFRYSVRDYFDDYTHVTVFTDWSLTRWLEVLGFRTVKILPRFLPGDSRNTKPKFPWLVRLYLMLPPRLRPFGQMMYCVAERS